jgi:hypothetical protein
VKVLDFGLAKMMQDPAISQLTRKGEVFGTPAYMSPEQAQGTSVDHRADIYSIGVIAYELFAGRLPFIYNSIPKLLIAHQHEQPAPPSHHLRPGQPPIPRDIEDHILYCLAKDPAHRLQSVDELIALFGIYLRRISVVGTRVVPNVVVQPGSSRSANADWCEVKYADVSDVTRVTLFGDDLLEEISDEAAALLPTQLPGKVQQVRGHQAPRGASRDWYWGQIVKKARTLADRLIKRRLGGEDLPKTTTGLVELEDSILALETEVAVARSQVNEMDSTVREAETRLRFAVMDLSMERGRLHDEGRTPPHVIQDLDYQIQTLEGRLFELYNRHAQKVAELVQSIDSLDRRLVVYRQRQVEKEGWLLNQLHHARPVPCPEDLSSLYARIDELLHGMQDVAQ